MCHARQESKTRSYKKVSYKLLGFQLLLHIYFFRLNTAFDYVEDESFPPSTSAVDIIIIPPENGICSDEESGDEDNPAINHLPKKMLMADGEVEMTYSNENEQPINSAIEATPNKKTRKSVWLSNGTLVRYLLT
jgi:hypothetical protein